MDGVSSMRVHASFNYSSSNYAIRLTDIYVIKVCNLYTFVIQLICLVINRYIFHCEFLVR